MQVQALGLFKGQTSTQVLHSLVSALIIKQDWLLGDDYLIIHIKHRGPNTEKDSSRKGTWPQIFHSLQLTEAPGAEAVCSICRVPERLICVLSWSSLVKLKKKRAVPKTRRKMELGHMVCCSLL